MRKEDLFEIIGEADERKVAAAGMAMLERRRPRLVRLRWGSAAACLCLIAASVFALPMLWGVHEAEPQPSGAPVIDIVQPGKENLLAVNEAESVTSLDMDVKLTSFNKLPYSIYMQVMEEFREFVGISYEEFTGRIPGNFEYCIFYSLSTRGYKDADLEEEYRLHDYVFEYRSEGGGDVTIALCADEEPLRDYFVECDNPKQSEINGVSVVIYGYQDSYMVQFSHENINYDIETRGVTQEELEALLVGIVG